MSIHPRFKNAVCILDMVDNASDLAGDLKMIGHQVVVLDQPDCVSADLVVVPSFGWSNGDEADSSSKFMVGGTDFLLVRQDVTLLRPIKNPAYWEPRIVVSFGGADPNHLTEKIAAALTVIPQEIKVQFVIGPGFEDFLVRSAHLFMDHPTYEIIDTGDPLETILPGAGLLVTAMGVTIAEANTLGTPVAVLANSDEDATNVNRLEKAGVVTNLGHGPTADSLDLGQQLVSLWRDADRRKRCAERGWQLVDGLGAQKAAKLICELVG